MAVIGSYNGAAIIAFPSKPGIRQLELEMNDTAASSRSPFTGTEQIQAWPGADWWGANITLPQLDSDDAAVWTAFLGELRGIANVFYLSDPLHRRPRGNPQGTPVIRGVNAAMATSLNIKGLTPNTARHLLPGDQLQVGQRLHRVLNVVNSDANGYATVSIWPSLREATSDNDPLILNNPRGLFRLAENKRSVLSTETRLTGVSIRAVEAR